MIVKLLDIGAINIIHCSLGKLESVSKENTAEVGHNVTSERPKRKVNLPKHLEDFVVGANNSVRKN
jgi:hypothetical protein